MDGNRAIISTSNGRMQLYFKKGKPFIIKAWGIPLSYKTSKNLGQPVVLDAWHRISQIVQLLRSPTKLANFQHVG